MLDSTFLIIIVYYQMIPESQLVLATMTDQNSLSASDMSQCRSVWLRWLPHFLRQSSFHDDGGTGEISVDKWRYPDTYTFEKHVVSFTPHHSCGDDGTGSSTEVLLFVYTGVIKMVPLQLAQNTTLETFREKKKLSTATAHSCFNAHKTASRMMNNETLYVVSVFIGQRLK